MAYEKHTWVCGETITADKMNHLENGVAEGGGGGSSPLVVHRIDSGSKHQLDKTWQEINNAFPNVYVEVVEGEALMNLPVSAIGSYGAVYMLALGEVEYEANSPTDYPSVPK